MPLFIAVTSISGHVYHPSPAILYPFVLFCVLCNGNVIAIDPFFNWITKLEMGMGSFTNFYL